MKIQTALLSVSDKEGIVELAQRLTEMQIEILSTGGTSQILKAAAIDVTAISEYTGFPEILDGRVKTLHPRVHGGILARHDNPEDLEVLQANNISPIGLVVVNLYPFSKTIQKEGVTIEEALEQIDIGGSTLVRAAAKNHQHTTVVVDPADYVHILAELKANNGETKDSTRRWLARKAFHHSAAYDAAIASYFESIETQDEVLPPAINLSLLRVNSLRYGENPHQRAALYQPWFSPQAGLGAAKQHQGKELSFNNYLDLEAAWNLCAEFEDACCVIIKHTNPCGTALGSLLSEAYEKALACDPVSAFGSIVAFNREVDRETADKMSSLFVEAVIATAYQPEAVEIFLQKKNLRVMEMGAPALRSDRAVRYSDFRMISGGFLVQDKDLYYVESEDLKTVTERAPDENETQDLLFAWTVCKHVKSNAIVYARSGQTVGIGAGQMSRVDSVRLAAQKAKLSLQDCVMASDGFFPFRDALDEAAQAGVKAVIQPGGSIQDEEVIRAANEHEMAMVFTGIRHFRH
ncbi:bifunctional phosphoribosylaminoimidazolecarboxamide formyltransferase/IMP cyclohydrolase [Acidobacteria bacterium AH-259-A15]|nr:bifunctional phosphoribosylaminoimidazolecarboxamide formyltransferase/IMP cyclohydrolase [Acidobacteria bacterium AH-259-A15]